MKKSVLISGLVFICFFFISQELFAQRYYRNDQRIDDDYYHLNLTREQIEEINKLEFQMEKELSTLFLKLRSTYIELDELEVQRSPDSNQIENIWDKIYKLEDEIRKKEIDHQQNIRSLLTEDQRALLDSYYRYGRGYLGRGLGRFGGMNYGYGRGGYGAVGGRNYWGRGAGRWRGGNYGYGRGIYRGYGRGYFGRGAGRFDPGIYPYYQRFRYGRGPCGAGLGKWYRWR